MLVDIWKINILHVNDHSTSSLVVEHHQVEIKTKYKVFPRVFHLYLGLVCWISCPVWIMGCNFSVKNHSVFDYLKAFTLFLKPSPTL